MISNSNSQLLKLLSSNEDSRYAGRQVEMKPTSTSCDSSAINNIELTSTVQPPGMPAAPVAVLPVVQDMIKRLNISIIDIDSIQNTPFFNERTGLATRTLPVPFV